MDEVDITQERAEAALEAHLANLRRQAQAMPEGKPGECDLCGEWSGRLVKGVCAPCRDKRGME